VRRYHTIPVKSNIRKKAELLYEDSSLPAKMGFWFNRHFKFELLKML
jgi:hypothetical protein